MPEPFTLALLLTAAFGGTVEALVGKTTENAPHLVERARSLFAFSKDSPATTAEQAVRTAVDAARTEILDRIAGGDLTLDPHVADDMVGLLDYAPFAEEVTKSVLFGGLPDLDRLRQAYIDRPASGGPSDTRWDNLEEPLLDFFESIRSHMRGDAILGPRLREVEILAMRARLEEKTGIIAEASRQAVAVQTRIAESTAQGANSLQTLVQVAARQAETGSRAEALLSQQVVSLNQMRDLLAMILETFAMHPVRPQPPGLTLDAEERTYLRLLHDECNRLPLALASDQRAAGARDAQQVELARVYVDLQTTSAPSWDLIFDRLRVPTADRTRVLKAMHARGAPTGGEIDGIDPSAMDPVARLSEQADFEKHPLRPWASNEEALRSAFQPLTALEALARQRRLVILGKPGSGKSTFVNHLAFVLAGALLGTANDWQALLGGELDRPLFPLRVQLRRWSAQMQPGSEAGLELVYGALEDAMGLADRAHLLARLEDPRTLVLFDGLDEVPAGGDDTSDRRRLVVASVYAFCVAHPDCAVLVTSRVKPYREHSAEYQISGLPVYELADLDAARIRRFTHRWYEELARVRQLEAGQAVEAREKLLTALGRNRDLAGMAATPLLLTMLARVNARTRLPDSRAELYDKCVEQLLWEWEKNKNRTGRDPTAGLMTGLVDLLQDNGIQLNRSDVERVLWELTFELHGQSGRESADFPSDLLEKRLARVHPHKHTRKAWASRVVELMRERGGLLVETEPGHFTFPHRTFQEYLAARGLLEREDPGEVAVNLASSDAWREVILLACGYLTFKGSRTLLRGILSALAAGDCDQPADWPRLLIVAQAWLDSGPHRDRDSIGKELRRKLPPLLSGLMQNAAAPAPQRLEAGLITCDLGERPGDLDARVAMAAKKKLGYEFQIGKYPVTNVQYRRFVEAGGYEQTQPWWDKEAIKETMRIWNEWPSAPRLWSNPDYDKDTQPVVAVSWYEARAYCRWLTLGLRQEGKIDSEQEVRLPTEEEWTWAAAGSAKRPYPWGDTFEAWRANTKESELDRPSPVHMYPGGATPEGVWDLAGNVWEWTNDDYTQWGKALRGGAYWNDAAGVGSAARVRPPPWYRHNYFGFRVVVVPVSRL